MILSIRSLRVSAQAAVRRLQYSPGPGMAKRSSKRIAMFAVIAGRGFPGKNGIRFSICRLIKRRELICDGLLGYSGAYYPGFCCGYSCFLFFTWLSDLLSCLDWSVDGSGSSAADLGYGLLCQDSVVPDAGVCSSIRSAIVPVLPIEGRLAEFQKK